MKEGTAPNEWQIRQRRHLPNAAIAAQLAAIGPKGVNTTDRPMQLTPDHDRRLVADIVSEWAAVHAQPFQLTLEGPAGGMFSQGKAGEAVTLDAIEFVQILSGRRPGTGILSHRLPL